MALPVRNAATVLEQRVGAWIGFLDKLHREYELLIVDDGSTDDTVAKAQTLALRHRTIVVLANSASRGFGAAIRTALAAVKHPLFFYTSLNYPYQPHDLQKLLERIDDVDIVCGYRSVEPLPRWMRSARKIGDMFLRVILGLRRDDLAGYLGGRAHWYSWLVRFVFGVQIVDVDAAFKLFRSEIFARIPIQSDGEFVHAEILAKANFLTCWMDEVAIGAADKFAKTNWRWDARGNDLRRILVHPDFGPPFLPAPTPATP